MTWSSAWPTCCAENEAITVAQFDQSTLEDHARPGKAGELVVHVAYVVAYAFDPGDHVIDGPADMEPFVRFDADYVVRGGSSWTSASRGLWVDQSDSYLTSVACGSAKTGRLTPAFAEPNFTGPSLTPEPGQFDPSKPRPTKDNCGG